MSMNAEIKNRWTAALRSGDYPQGEGYLRTENNTYCCLGVLSELAVQAGVIDPPLLAENDQCYCYGAHENSSFLPDEVSRWAGVETTGFLGTAVPSPDGRECDSLAALNDAGVPFSTIADVIEEHL